MPMPFIELLRRHGWAFGPGTADHYRPQRVKEVFAFVEGVSKTLEHPMFTNRPQRLRNLAPTGASLN